MLNIVSLLFNLISQHVLWVYAGCALVLAFYARAYLRARHDRDNTIFTVEREVAAHREGQAMSGIGVMMGLVVVVTLFRFYLMPTINLEALAPPSPTPTGTLAIPTRAAPTSSPTLLAPSATPSLRPTPTLGATATPNLTPAPTAVPRPACANPNVCIARPGAGATLSGAVAIVGTAYHERFQFFKVEYAAGEKPGAWNVIGGIQRAPVLNGVLAELNTAALPNGVYWLQLTVVDQTGNFPPPYQVRVVIQN